MQKALAIAAMLVLSAGPSLSALEEHQAIAPGSPETPARKLQTDLAAGKKVLVIDVRSPKEYEEGHVAGAVNIPLDELSKKIAGMKLPQDTVIVTMCDHGGRSSRAAMTLEKLGFKTSSFCRLEDWKKQGFKLEKGAKKAEATPVYKFTCHHYCLADKEVVDLDEMCDCACRKPYRECMKSG